jgi:hypothetical protein
MQSVLSRLDKLGNAYNLAPRVKKVWIRNDEIIHPLRGSGPTIGNLLKYCLPNPKGTDVDFKLGREILSMFDEMLKRPTYPQVRGQTTLIYNYSQSHELGFRLNIHRDIYIYTALC